VKLPLWQKVGSEVYSCCWASPSQSFSGPCPTRLLAIISLSQISDFYCRLRLVFSLDNLMERI
jgi:hypothetical protein